MELSVSDLSKHLGVSPDTIERWVRQGKLPVSKKGTNCWFRISELENWALKNNMSLDFSDKGVQAKQKASETSLSEAIQRGGIYFDIQGNDVQTVLKACIEKISKIPDDFKADLLDRLNAREQALSTGIGNGIAIPHPREQLGYLDSPVVSVCFLANQVEYKALDQQPVSILFFILCPVLKMHLHLLSALSYCLRDSQFTGFLKSKPNLDQLVERIEILQKANPL